MLRPVRCATCFNLRIIFFILTKRGVKKKMQKSAASIFRMVNSSTYRARITVTVRKSILDPQGKAIHHALKNLGLSAVEDVRLGKYIDMKIQTGSKEEAERLT